MKTCTKVKFTKKEAQEKLNIFLKNGNFKKGRVYPCNICIGFWHITHRNEAKTTERIVKPVGLKMKDKWEELIKK